MSFQPMLFFIPGICWNHQFFKLKRVNSEPGGGAVCLSGTVS
jgi:hypothetical protein